MTAQVPDRVEYRGKTYSIAGTNGKGLFDPTAHGLKPTMRSTACWRGFICTYAVVNGRLMLFNLAIGLKDSNPPLFGVVPTPQPVGPLRSLNSVYEGLNLPVSYTGGLLLADDFVENLYVHMGFHPAWKYRDVHELLFQEGALIEASDRSAVMAEVREKWGREPMQPGFGADRAAIAEWIEKSFRLDYGR
ncbi:MAG: hypothetical protein ACRCZF_11370 [Gemmataceae bacterium]